VIHYRSPTWLPHLDHNGRLLAVAGEDGTVTITDLASSRVLHTLQWPRPRESAVFSGDDSLVAAGGSDGQIAIWDAATGHPSGQPLDTGGGIAHAVFDPHNRDRLFVVTNTGTLTTWDRHDPQHPRQVGKTRVFASDAANGSAPTVTISPDGRLLAAGDPFIGHFDGPIQVWDTTRSNSLIRTAPGALGVFGSDGVTLPVGYGDDTVLINARTGHPETTLPNTGPSPLAALSPDGRRIAVAQQVQNASVVVVYDRTSLKPIGLPLRLHGNRGYPVGFLPDGRLVTSGNNEAAIWTLGRTLPPVGVTLLATGDLASSDAEDIPESTIFLPGTGEIITRGHGGGTLLQHDPTTGARLGPLLNGRIQSAIAASPDGRLLAASSADETGAAIWDVTTGEQLAPLAGVPYGVELSWSPGGQLVAADAGLSLQLWNVADPKRPVLAGVVAKPPGAARLDYLLFSPDSRRLFTASASDKLITGIDVTTRRTQWTISVHDTALRQVALSPDGKTLAVDSGDTGSGQVTLYSTTSGSPMRSVSTQSYGGVGFLHGGHWLVVTGGASPPGAQLYDAMTLQPIGVPFPMKGPFGDPLAVNGTGTMFSEAEFDDPLLWDVDPAHWQTSACRIAGRNLTQAEWHQYLPNRPYQATCREWPAGP
jgi:WD40 repeat protein